MPISGPGKNSSCQIAKRPTGSGRDVEIEAMKFDRYLERHQSQKVLAVALDLTKAYDSVDHQILCHLWATLGMHQDSVAVLRRATMKAISQVESGITLPQ